MIHQKQTGLVLGDLLKPLIGFIGKAGTHHAKDAQNANQYTPEKIRFLGEAVLRSGQRHHFIIGQGFDRRLQVMTRPSLLI